MKICVVLNVNMQSASKIKIKDKLRIEIRSNTKEARSKDCPQLHWLQEGMIRYDDKQQQKI